MKRWRAFTALNGHLRAGLLGARRQRHWLVAPELLIEISSQHLVTPALAWSTRGMRLRADFRDYLDAVLVLNERRNRILRAALERVIAQLNAVGIEPLLLKGAAYLVDGLYPAPGIRVIGDLDVLIPAGRAHDARAVVDRIGYQEAHPEADWAAPHHLPRLTEPGSGASLELHTALAEPPHDAIIPADWMCRDTRPAMLPGLRAWLPSATRAVAHIVVHDQLHHRAFSRGEANLRELLDLAMIRARHEHAIDWGEIAGRFSASGQADVLAAYLAYTEALFGQTMPAFAAATPAAAAARLRATVEEPERRRREQRRAAMALRWRTLRTNVNLKVRRSWTNCRAAVTLATAPMTVVARAAFGYAIARGRDPGGLIDLYKPGTWQRGVQRIRQALKSPRR
jgi:hypothetical protein